MTRILLIDDNKLLLSDISFHLEMRGYEVITAASGDEALHILENELPDIIVSDISMPGLNGYQLLEICQANSQWAEIPFIFLTAYSSQEDMQLAKTRGADDFLAKPFHMDDLVVTIENRLRRIAQWKAKIDHLKHELLAQIHHEGGADSKLSDMNMVMEDLEAMPDDFSQRAFEALQRLKRHTNRLIDHIILLTKIDQGQIKTYYQEHAAPCDLGLVIENACQSILQDFAPDSPTFYLTAPKNTVDVYTMFDLLVLVVAEVLRNAALYSQHGIQVSWENNRTEAIIKVIDRGSGMTDEQLSRVWERFAQFQRTGRMQQGTGLGLSIVYELMKVMEGHVTIESYPGKGTTVTLSLPAMP
jgi:two-component system, sensor histidine kinase and response regulator